MSTSEPPRKVTTPKLRDEWVRLAAVQKLSPMLRVVGMRLAHFYNLKTGQLNPSYALLAAECDTTERTAQKAVAAFRMLGMIAGARSSGGREDATNDFVLILPYRRVFTRTPVKTKSRVSTWTPVTSNSGTARGVHADGRGVSRSVVEGCPPGHPNNVRENSVRNSAPPARSSTPVVRGDAAITQPTPLLCAAKAAQRQSPEGQPQLNCDNYENPGGAAALANAHAPMSPYALIRRAFEEDVLGVYPPSRIGDVRKAYRMFIVAADQRPLSGIIATVTDLMRVYNGNDVPLLVEALASLRS